MVHQRGFDFISDLRKSIPEFKPKIIFDVGANIGQSSLLYAKEFPGSKIYSFEPVTTTFEQLQRNTKHISDCLCFNLGFSAKPGVAQMLSYLDYPTLSRMKKQEDGEEDQPKDNSRIKHIEVCIDTLDHFCEKHNIGKIDLLKIDAEGHDLMVLKGAVSILCSGRAEIIMVEAGMNKDNKLHAPFIQIFEYLQSFDYYLFAFYEQTEEWVRKMPHLRRTNPVFIKQTCKQSYTGQKDLKTVIEGKRSQSKNDKIKLTDLDGKTERTVIRKGLLSEVSSLYEAGDMDKAEKLLGNYIQQLKDSNR